MGNCFLVPNGSPSFIAKNQSDHESLSLIIGDVPIAQENGIIVYYNVSYTSQDWPDDFYSANSSLIQHSDGDLSIWNQMLNVQLDCSFYRSTPNPPSSKNATVLLKNLFPFTNYEVLASPCTIIGCGPQYYTASFQTDATFPSCSPNITMFNESSTSMTVQWIHLDYKCLHGVLNQYTVFLFESSERYELNRTDIRYFQGIQTSNASSVDEEATVTLLRKYWNYTAVLFTENNVGYSPPSIAIWAVTAEDSK